MACIILLAAALDSGNSTSAIAVVLFPIYALLAIILVWFGVFLVFVIRRAYREARFANRNAKPS